MGLQFKYYNDLSAPTDPVSNAKAMDRARVAAGAEQGRMYVSGAMSLSRGRFAEAVAEAMGRKKTGSLLEASGCAGKKPSCC